MKASIRLCVQYSAPRLGRFRISLSKPSPTEQNKTEHETEIQQDAKEVSQKPRLRLRVPVSIPTEKQQTDPKTQKQQNADERTEEPRLGVRFLKSMPSSKKENRPKHKPEKQKNSDESIEEPRFHVRFLKSRPSSTKGNQAEHGTGKQQDPKKRHEKDFSLSFELPPFHVDPDSKKVTTASGTLPLSPIMDPTFHEARGKYTIKAKERGPSRSEIEHSGLDLWNNIYAKALATPVRTCAATRAALPNFFHTKFTSVRNPLAENNWLVPEEVSLNTDGQTYLTEIPGAGTYLLCRQQLYREFFIGGSKYSNAPQRFGKLTARSRREIIGPKTAVWREDMDTYLLNLLRSHITQCLIRFAGMVETAGRKYISNTGSWDEAEQRLDAGCFLYLGPEPAIAGQDTTDESQRPSIPPPPPPPPPPLMKLKASLREWEVPIYDLRTLLGESNVARLRRRKELWRDGEIFVLRGKRTQKLQMQLWRLLGYKATQDGLPPWAKTPGRSSRSDDSVENSSI